MEFVNELNLFKDIVSTLTGASIYLMGLYVFTKAMGIAAWVYFGKLLITAVVSILKADISKSEARDLDDENYRLKREIAEVKSSTSMEVEKVKHLYKILKESKGVDDAR